MSKGKRYKPKGKRYITKASNKKVKLKPHYLICMLVATILVIFLFNINSIFAYFRANEQKTNSFNIAGTYTVTFYSNNGTGTMEPQSILPWIETNLTANSFTRNGYSFENWNTQADGNGTTYTNEQAVTNIGDTTLYAQWTMDTYNIEYILNDGTVEVENPDTYTIQTASFTLNNPSKTGYTFKGWSGTGLTGDTNTTVTVAQGNYGNRSYTANYTANTYYIKFNANGGSNSMSNQTMTYDTASNLTSNNFTKTGYTFSGWNTVADGSGTSYTNSQSVSNLTATNGDIFNLYAQWKPQPIKYAVQIYGINQDVGADGTTKLGLTFGPAVGADYNNSYVTHEYEETSEGSREYYVKIVTHTVSASGTETTSSNYLCKNGGTTDKVTRTEAQVTARQNINLHKMTWAQIKQVGDKTLFEDCMLCGDTKSVSLTLNSTIASGNAYNQYGDGAGVLNDSINTYYKIWNPSTSQNDKATNGGNYGSNAGNAGGYSTSHIRATLIGENAKTDVTYAGDVNLDKDTCLYSCIESDLRDVITPKKIKYVTGTGTASYSLNDDIADSIWLFSDREMYGTGEYSGGTTEGLDSSSVTNYTGVGYDKFANTESKYYISSYNKKSNNNRIANNEHGGGGSSMWLRSPNLNGTVNVGNLGTMGGYGGYNAYNTDGLALGFCIE